MSKIVEYGISYESNLFNLATEVRKQINDGWQPFGGITIDQNQGLYMQVVVRYEDPAPVSFETPIR